MNVTGLINLIIEEWAYRVNDGMPNPKNPTHLKELGIVLSEMGLSHIKKDLIENLITEKGKTPQPVKEEEKSFSNPILNKKISYKDKEGNQKDGIVGNLLRQPEGTPARDAAEKVLPPEGSPERDALNQELGGGSAKKGEEKPKDGADSKAAEKEKQQQAQAMFDPKADPAMAARLDKEKEVQAQLAKDAEKDKEAEKPKEEPKKDSGFEPIPAQDVQKEIPEADPETFGAPSDFPDGIEKQDLEKFNTDISKVQQIVADAKAKGEKAPDINLCDVTVPGTNLYCDDNLGIPRDQMPQFKGKPVPGSKAEKMPLNKDGEVDTEPVFREMLKEKGIKTTQTEVPADKLKATQSELGGDKVVGMMGALEKDPNHPGITGPIYVSRDGFVIDGHHRWAAIAAYNAKYPDKQIPMKCEVIDMDIKDAIPMCNKFAENIGIAAKKQGETTGKAGEEQPEEKPKKVSSFTKLTDKIKQKISKWQKDEKEYFENGYYKAGSEARRTLGQTIKDKAAGAWKAVKDGFKHEVKEFKTAGVAVGKLFSEAGGWNDLSHHEKDALKAVGVKIVTTALFGAALGGLSYGAVGFAKHVAIEFVPHVVAETFLKGAGRAALFADAEGEAEMDAKFVKFAEMIADGLENMDINEEQMEAMVDSYNQKKEKGEVDNTEAPQMKEELLPMVDKMIAQIIEGFIQEVGPDTNFAAKSKETGKIVYFKSQQAKDSAIKAGTHDEPKDKDDKKDKEQKPTQNIFTTDPSYQQRLDKEKDITQKSEPKTDTPSTQKQSGQKLTILKGKSSGENIQTMEMEGGGFVYGTKHRNTAMVDDILDDVKSKIPKERWGDIVFVGEGGATNDAGELEFNDEMKYAAPKFKKIGAGVDTWDGDDMDVHNDQSKLYQKQKEKTGFNDSQVKAGNWASMIGQGEGTDTMSPNDFLDDEGKQFLQDAAKEAGLPPIENWDNPTGESPSEENPKGSGDKGTLYRLSFPEDNGDKPTKINDIQVAFNEIRDENLIEKNKELTAKGKIPIIIAGESHVELVQKMTSKADATPASDGMATVNNISSKTGLRAQAIAGWADENGVNLSKVLSAINSKKLKPMDLMTAVAGNPGNKYAKDIISKYSQSSSSSKDGEAAIRTVANKAQRFKTRVVKNLLKKKLDNAISKDVRGFSASDFKTVPGEISVPSKEFSGFYHRGGGYYSQTPDGPITHVLKKMVESVNEAPKPKASKVKKADLVPIEDLDLNPSQKAAVTRVTNQAKKEISELPSPTNDKTRKDYRDKTKKSVTDSLRLKKSDVAKKEAEEKAKLAADIKNWEKSGKKGPKPKKKSKGVGLGSPDSRAGESAVVLGSIRIHELVKEGKTYQQARAIVEKELMKYVGSDTYLTKSWVKSALNTLDLLEREVGFNNIAEFGWDNPEGRALVGSQGHGTSADMFIKTKKGKRIGVSLKKDLKVFVFNGGYTEMSENLKERGFSFSEKSSPEHYVKRRTEEFERGKNDLIENKDKTCKAWNSIKKNPAETFDPLDKRVGHILKKTGKSDLSKVSCDDFINNVLSDTSSDTMKMLSQFYQNPAVEAITPAYKKLRALDKELTDSIADDFSKPENEKLVKDLVRDETHISDILFSDNPNLDELKVVYGTDPAIEMKKEKLIQLFGVDKLYAKYEKETNPTKKEALKKKIEEEINNRITVSSKGGVMSIAINVTDSNGKQSAIPLFEAKIRTRGIGAAPTFEMAQNTFGGLSFKYGTSDFTKWDEKDRKVVVLSTLNDLEEEFGEELQHLDKKTQAEIGIRLQELEKISPNSPEVKKFRDKYFSKVKK